MDLGELFMTMIGRRQQPVADDSWLGPMTRMYLGMGSTHGRSDMEPEPMSRFVMQDDDVRRDYFRQNNIPFTYSDMPIISPRALSMPTLDSPQARPKRKRGV